MDSSKPQPNPPIAGNPSSNPVTGAQSNLSASTPQSAPKVPIPPSPWASQISTFPAQPTGGPTFPEFSATTAEILKRLQATQGNATNTPAFEAKRAEVLQTFITSDKIPTPPPNPHAGRRGRAGGRVSTPSALSKEVSASSAPAPGRGSGRGRGRGRGGGRGGKRKRAESVDSDEDDDSDISSSYTPLPTRTKSGRSVNRPVAFVPTIPEPTREVKRRRSTKTMLAAQCKICHRGTEPSNNRIVFCDVCNTAYHQYCHDPPIDNEVVNVLEKEWLCGPCERSRQNVIEGTDGLLAAEGLSIDDKRAYFSTLPQARLVSLLLHATIRHPELPIFPPNVHDLIPDSSSSPVLAKPAPSSTAPPPPPLRPSVTSSANGHGSTSSTPRSQHITTQSSEIDPAEAQLLGEIHHSHHPAQRGLQQSAAPPPTAYIPRSTIIATNNNNNGGGHSQPQIDEYDDGYDTDPPAHYPKPGHGLARTLRPESEDLNWLVDDNFEVFSHGWKGDGTGLGADGALGGLGEAAAMEGGEGGRS